MILLLNQSISYVEIPYNIEMVLHSCRNGRLTVTKNVFKRNSTNSEPNLNPNAKAHR